MKVFLLSPFTYWARWVLVSTYLKLKHRGKNLCVEYMADIQNVKFGINNTINHYARVRYAELGDFTYVARASQVHHTKVGKFTCIGPNVQIGLGAHPTSKFVSSHPIFYSTLGQAGNQVWVENNLFSEYPITLIGNDVWIGAGAIIKSGIEIGDGAIIASGAIVTKDVKPFSIVGGVPAKHIKFRFSEDEIIFLLKTKWWDKDHSWIKKHKELFLDISAFKAFYSEELT